MHNCDKNWEVNWLFWLSTLGRSSTITLMFIVIMGSEWFIRLTCTHHNQVSCQSCVYCLVIDEEPRLWEWFESRKSLSFNLKLFAVSVPVLQGIVVNLWRKAYVKLFLTLPGVESYSCNCSSLIGVLACHMSQFVKKVLS